jgi:hypothetical protein
MPLAATGIFRLGWIGVVILVACGGLRLFMWARESPRSRFARPARPAQEGAFAESWRTVRWGALIFFVGVVISAALSRVPGYVVMTIGGAIVAWYAPRGRRSSR